MMGFVCQYSPLERGGFERNEREAKKRGVSNKLKFCPAPQAVKKSKIK